MTQCMWTSNSWVSDPSSSPHELPKVAAPKISPHLGHGRLPQPVSSLLKGRSSQWKHRGFMNKNCPQDPSGSHGSHVFSCCCGFRRSFPDFGGCGPASPELSLGCRHRADRQQCRTHTHTNLGIAMTCEWLEGDTFEIFSQRLQEPGSIASLSF